MPKSPKRKPKGGRREKERDKLYGLRSHDPKLYPEKGKYPAEILKMAKEMNVTLPE